MFFVFEVGGPVSLSLSKTHAQRPLPACFDKVPMTCYIFEADGPVTLSLSKGRAERPLPAMVRQAHRDSPFYDVIPPSEIRKILPLIMRCL